MIPKDLHNEQISKKAESRRFRPNHSDVESLKDQVEKLSEELFRLYNSRSWAFLRRARKFIHSGVRSTIHSSLSEIIASYVRARRKAEIIRRFGKIPSTPGINITDQLGIQSFHHRSGWTFAVDYLSALNNRAGIYLDTFIERTFAASLVPTASHLAKWIGICHVPSTFPEWFSAWQKSQFYDIYSRNIAWQQSIQHCLGLFALSESHAQELRRSTGLPVCTLFHPTEVPTEQWTVEKYLANKSRKIIQIGWWLRKMHAIFQAPFPSFQKILLKIASQPWVDEYFMREEDYLKKAGQFREDMRESVLVCPYVSNREYDRLLSRNIAFLDLYGSSANNAIIECMARGTPILVNKLPAVMEYLGDNYPLYYSSYEEAAQKSRDIDLLEKANALLKSTDARRKINPITFFDQFCSSSIYQKLAKL